MAREIKPSHPRHPLYHNDKTPETSITEAAVTQHQEALAIRHSQITFTGLTAGHVWKASSSTAASFAALVAGDIPDLPTSKITSGVFPVARLGTGTPDGTKFLRDDGTFVTPSGGGGGGAPTTVDYLVKTADATLSAERVVTDTTEITWDWATGGQAKASVGAIAASKIGSGTIATARLGSGTADATTFLRGDQTYAVPPGSGVVEYPMVQMRATSAYIELPASAIWATEVPTTFTVEFLLLAHNWSSFGGPLALGSGGDSFIIHTTSGIIAAYPNTLGSHDLQLQRDGLIRRVSISRNAGDIKLYLDGVWVADTTISTSAAISLSGTQRRLMGDGGSEGMKFQAMADLRIWSAVRTDAQIYDNAWARLTGSETNLLAYWKMDEGTGTTVNDLTSNNWDGTLNGSLTWIKAKRWQ